MRRKPKRKIENKIFAKIIRTIGFIALAISGLIITLALLATLNIEHDILTKVQDVIDKITFLTSDIVGYTFLGGLLLLLVTQTKSWFGKIVVALITLVGSATLLKLVDSSLLTGINLLNGSPLDFIEISVLSEPYVYVSILALFVLTTWGILAYRRPLRISHVLVRIGSIALFVAFIMSAIPLFGVTVGETYETVYTYFYLANFGLLTLGSLFGIIGFFRS